MLINFELRNYLNLVGFQSTIITDRTALKKIINDNFLDLPKSSVLNDLREFDDDFLKHNFDKVAIKLCKEALESKGIVQLGHSVNLTLCLFKYLQIEGKENLGESIQQIHQHVLEKTLIYHFDKKDTSDDEFYYAVGQLFHYLFSLGCNRNFDAINFDPTIIKSEIEKFMKKYECDIKFGSKTEIFRLANLLSLIFAHQPQTDKIHEEYFLAGLGNGENAMFYEKK